MSRPAPQRSGVVGRNQPDHPLHQQLRRAPARASSTISAEAFRQNVGQHRVAQLLQVGKGQVAARTLVSLPPGGGRAGPGCAGSCFWPGWSAAAKIPFRMSRPATGNSSSSGLLPSQACMPRSISSRISGSVLSRCDQPQVTSPCNRAGSSGQQFAARGSVRCEITTAMICGCSPLASNGPARRWRFLPESETQPRVAAACRGVRCPDQTKSPDEAASASRAAARAANCWASGPSSSSPGGDFSGTSGPRRKNSSITVRRSSGSISPIVRTVWASGSVCSSVNCAASARRSAGRGWQSGWRPCGAPGNDFSWLNSRCRSRPAAR